MTDIDKSKKIKKYIPGNMATPIIREQTERKNALKCDEDTIIRTEIHGIISSYLKERKNPKDIVDELSKNPRYEKYNAYFERWIADKIKKVQRKEKHK